MGSPTYQQRRSRLEAYFDRTAADAWARLTSDDPVSRIRATVREGREQMMAHLLGQLPADLSGRRILDAGCGTGALAVEAARRGADVVAIDLSPTLVNLARERLPSELGGGRIEFRVGDMTDPDLGTFDHVVAMDSLVHYVEDDMVRIVSSLAERGQSSTLFTFAPQTFLLTLMHTVGRLFPRGDRAPFIEPISPERLRRRLIREGLHVGASERVARGFYTSQFMEVRAS